MFNLIVIKVMATMKEARSTMLKNGAKEITNVVINNVNVTPLEEYTEMYYHLRDAFGITSSGWSMIHEQYSPSMFCRENRLNIVGEYLVWKDFVEHAKKFDVPYYVGINTFLAEYQRAVERCLTNMIL